jgi:citrate/tricarballylate utilization protein
VVRYVIFQANLEPVAYAELRVRYAANTKSGGNKKDITGNNMYETEALAEANRLMTVCNSCRYCEGLCAVFPALEKRRIFNNEDLHYLANLCHNCGACYIDCQYSPPHSFNVNVPQALSRVRRESYAKYTWPAQFSGVFQRNGLAIAVASALSVAGFLIGFAAYHDPAKLFGAQDAGSFYALMPHSTMVAIFGAAFLYGIVAMLMGGLACWREFSGENRNPSLSTVWRAIQDVVRLRYLDGGGSGCYVAEEPQDKRRVYHHFTFYGFMLCFASTCTATLYHVFLHREPPFPWWDIPVVLGTVGGIGLIVGCAGLICAKKQRDHYIQEFGSYSMEIAFIAMLLASSVTGFALLFLRHTPAMGLLLAVHLGVIFALFITMPYSKMVHGLYRFIALIQYAHETQLAHNKGAAQASDSTAPKFVVAITSPKQR